MKTTCTWNTILRLYRVKLSNRTFLALECAFVKEVSTGNVTILTVLAARIIILLSRTFLATVSDEIGELIASACLAFF